MHWGCMSKPYYPKIDLGSMAALTTVRQQMTLFEDYLTHADCPYDKDTRGRLERMFAPNVVEKVVEKIVERKAKTVLAEKAAEGGKTGPKLKGSGVDLDAVSTEIQGLRTELTQLKMDSKTLQTADKISIIKTRAALVEKLVSMDEKTNNLKRQALFQSTIMGILDDLVPSDRRVEFLARLRPFAAEEAA